ncbi:Uma2 family endonuclease [Nonomuraea soli]|nr:Uma2 family endonuclease [Nonomuraea soli]
MTIAQMHGPVLLPDSPYRMWLEGTLDDYLHVPDGSRVEIIDGEIVVSVAPGVPHAYIAETICKAVYRREFENPGYPWRALQGPQLDFMAWEDGYIPDIMLLDHDLLKDAVEARSARLVPDQAEVIVEITSQGNARRDRPGKGTGKWCAYARAEVPYYLLVDLDPKVAATTLYSIPDAASAAYLHEEVWPFGEAIALPDPLNLRIPTDTWLPWD